jgi:hypothetical protein
MRSAFSLLVLVSSLCAISLGAQQIGASSSMSHDSHAIAIPDSVAEFAKDALAGVEAFRDRDAAVAAGYKRIGMDFPSMGEHWVNTAVLYRGGFDLSTPALLSYATVDGRPVLTGAVYAILLAPGELPPSVPGGIGKWHDHSGTLTDESALPVHHGGMSDLSATRLLVLHAWVGVPNPDGLFEADNWALPYVRAGVPVPNPLSIDAARALSLLSGSRDYYIALAVAAGATPGGVAPILDSCANVATSIAAHMRATKQSDVTAVAALKDAWRSAMQRIARDAGPKVAARLNGGNPVQP